MIILHQTTFESINVLQRKSQGLIIEISWKELEMFLKN